MKFSASLLAVAFCLPLAAQPTLIEQGRAALARNDAELAARLLERATAQSPANAEAHYLLGEAYGFLARDANIFRQPGLARKAHHELDRAVQLDPNHLDARFVLIEFYMLAPGFMGGDAHKAMQQAEEIRKRDRMAGHRALANIYNHQKKRDQARKEYLDAVKEQPDSPEAHYWLGISFLTADSNYKNAHDEFETAVKLDPAFMPGWFQIGHMAALSGANLQGGEEALQKYLAYAPKPDEPPLFRAHFWLGAIYEKLGKRAEARQRYMASLRINPNQKDVAEALRKIS